MCSVIFLQVLQIVVRPVVPWLCAGGQARVAAIVALVAFACYSTVLAIARVIRNGLLAPAFLEDVFGGALEFAVASFKLGSPLGVVSADAVRAKERQRIAAELGYSEMVFMEDPSLVSASGRAEIFPSAQEPLPAGHYSAGAAWWQRQRGTLAAAFSFVLARSKSITQVTRPQPRCLPNGLPNSCFTNLIRPRMLSTPVRGDYSDIWQHWAWVDKAMGHIRARVFAPGLGSREGGETGAAAVPTTDDLSGDLVVTQGEGSVIYKSWRRRGWVALGGRVIHEGRLPIP